MTPISSNRVTKSTNGPPRFYSNHFYSIIALLHFGTFKSAILDDRIRFPKGCHLVLFSPHLSTRCSLPLTHTLKGQLLLKVWKMKDSLSAFTIGQSSSLYVLWYWALLGR